ncbi:rod shape-determining protein RodA [Rhodovibrio sodomensis]|uniref:Rod shape-determining protein RodA n=1 Tax=Rhodovibrio sodomensis TaxID=1088 RepID=A0ABS1D9Z2_9PROT|nr:DUF4399 domain-containing protein [Rhodovibrio sodomensis]MBK1667246.1 rod shape-determining protein RodA [Rhodovibrio sodomensis]
MIKYLTALAAAAAVSLPLAAAAQMDRTPAPEGANVYIITPSDGERVTSPVTVRFGANNVGVAPSGVDHENTGHHHLLVDTGLPNLNSPIPADDNHIHFGGGQTQTTIDLEPGEHTLRLLMGDARHVPHDPPIASATITITVAE